MKKVAIVARGGTNCLAPFRDPEWEIWGMPWISYPRVDRVFEIHSQTCADEAEEWFRSGGWVTEFNARCPDVECVCDPSRLHLFANASEYPLAEVMAGLPIATLENTIAYMIALAIHEGREEIGLWGVHMYASPEADFALASNAYLVGLAQGRGIKVTIPPGSPFLASNFIDGRYGVRCGHMRPRFYSAAGISPNT